MDLSALNTASQPTSLPFGATTSGDNTLVAADAGGRKIRVLQVALTAAVDTNLYFTSDPAGTAIFGDATNKVGLLAKTPFVLPFSPMSWFETAAGEALVLNLSTTGPVSGVLTYCFV